MKKTLAAVAVLGAFAGSAIAADVTLYGVVDLGLNYSHVDMDGVGDDLDTFEMKSGQQSGSRWGLKGTEDLGNGLTVGFVLENGFTADDGVDGGSAMFDRESMLFLEGNFGKLAFGRIGSFNQGQGSFSKIGMLTPFGTSFGDYAAQAGNIFASSTRYANSIVYETPSFAGFQVTAMYSTRVRKTSRIPIATTASPRPTRMVPPLPTSLLIPRITSPSVSPTAAT